MMPSTGRGVVSRLATSGGAFLPHGFLMTTYTDTPTTTARLVMNAMVRTGLETVRSRAAVRTLATSALGKTGGPKTGGGGGSGLVGSSCAALRRAWISVVATRSTLAEPSPSSVGRLASLLRHSSQVPSAWSKGSVRGLLHDLQAGVLDACASRNRSGAPKARVDDSAGAGGAGGYFTPLAEDTVGAETKSRSAGSGIGAGLPDGGCGGGESVRPPKSKAAPPDGGGAGGEAGGGWSSAKSKP